MQPIIRGHKNSLSDDDEADGTLGLFRDRTGPSLCAVRGPEAARSALRILSREYQPIPLIRPTHYDEGPGG